MTAKSPPTRARRAFTIVELLVVVSIILLLLALLAPTTEQALEAGRAAKCMTQIRQVGMATRFYINDFRNRYPYGVPKPMELVDHPHNQGWLPDGSRGGGVSPQQQFFTQGYITEHKLWACPTDPTPQNYIWWDYTHRPDFQGEDNVSSYMFSEEALFGVAWKNRVELTSFRVQQPDTFGWAADGWECPNGWDWARVDPADPHRRIDWTHMRSVNVLFGDFHVEPIQQDGIGLILRDHPISLSPLD